MSHTKPCPVNGCGALIRRTDLVCSECWKRMPDHGAASLLFANTEGLASNFRPADRERIVAYLNSLPPLPTLDLEPAHA